MGVGGRDWIGRLPAEFDGQRTILYRLLALSEADDDISWLVIGCSLARGAGDRLSDLDVAMGIRDECFTATRDRVRAAADNLGNLVDSFHHQLPGVATVHERIFAQYADRCQLDLVLLPAAIPSGSVPGAVVLYDQDHQLTASDQRGSATPEQIREWAFRGWCALADLGKYLRRQSAWEALDRLHEARAQLWQLQAAACGIPDPQYGLTSILDFAPGQVPAGMQATVSDLDPVRLLSAGQHLAALLSRTGEHLRSDQQAVLPHAMARYITADLESLNDPRPGD